VKMIAAPLPPVIQQPAPVLRLLVELPSWPRVFFGNLRDFVFPRPLPALELRSAPAPFWADVFVTRPLPWNRFLQSVACHVVVFGLVIGFTRFFALQPQVVARPTFDHSQVVYYKASEYLPPLDTLSAARPRKANPELSRQASSRQALPLQALSLQPIISLPREADNRSQTIVAPPSVKLKRDVALPNIVDWSNNMSEKMEKPRLAIPPVPLTPAADITRIAPHLENSVVTPPPDAAHLAHRRNSNSPGLQTSVVAPPPDLSAPNSAALQAPQLAVIAPPPSVESPSTRVRGDLNIGRSSVIAPAPRLPVSEQRTFSGSLSGTLSGSLSASRSSSSGGGFGTPQVVPPPPSVSAAGSSGESFGGRGRVIALNLHPAVGAPPSAPQGNRRGAFAATTEGQLAASGGSNENAGRSTRKGTSDAPAGLYVGSAGPKPSPVAGDPRPASGTPASANSVNPNLLASVSPARVTSAPSRGMQPGSSAKLSEAERQVFGDRKFYSLTLNMPNLNSAAGSWVIRFAELGHDSTNADASNHDSNNRDSNQDANARPAELSPPAAIRKVDPAYPLQLMRQNVGGTVILYAIIHADGTVGNVRVLRGVDERLDRFASQAVAQWQFQPATKNGSPVDVEATFQIPFRPPRAGTDF
jgi:TonB family protein